MRKITRRVVPSALCLLALIAFVGLPGPATARVGESADLKITKTDSADPVNIGEPFDYIYTIQNLGPDTATPVNVIDSIPDVSIVALPPECQEIEGDLTCYIADLAAGAQKQLVVTVQAESLGNIGDTASVFSVFTDDPNPANNEDTETTTVIQPPPDYTLTLADSPDPVNVGQPLDYTITVENLGPGGADSQGVTVVLPASVNVASLPPDCTQSSGVVSCGTPEIGNGGSWTGTIRVIPQRGGEILTTATIGGPDTNDTDTETTTVLGGSGASANLSVTKSDGADPIEAGEPLEYTLAVDNMGPNEADDVRLTDLLPPSVTVTHMPSDCSKTGQLITCEIAQLTYRAHRVFSITVIPEEAGEITNTATVSSAVSGDPEAANNTDSESTIVQPGGPGPTPPVASVTERPADLGDGLVSFNTAATTDAKRLLWSIEGTRTDDALRAFETSANAPFTVVRVPKPGAYNVQMTAIGPGGSSVSSEAITVSDFGKKVLDPRLPSVAFSGPTAASLDASAQIDKPCVAGSEVVFGTIEARGCFNQVLAAEQIPPRERPVVGEWFDSQLKKSGCGIFFTIGTGKCFTKPEYLGVVTSDQPVKVNGLTITPRNGASVVLFPPTGKIVSEDAKVTLYGTELGTITAHSGPLNLGVGTGDLANTGGGGRYSTRLWSFDANSLPKIGGFSIDGQMSINLVAERGKRFSELAVNMTLPEQFSTSASTRPTGSVAITADNDNGLMLDQLYFSVPEAFLGGVRLANLSFTYKSRGEPNATPACASKWWKATAEIFIIPAGDEKGAGLSLAPPPDREGVAFCAGGFHSAGGDFTFGKPFPPPQIFPGVFLNSIGFNMALNPTVFSGTASVKAADIVTATGGLLAAFPSTRAPYVVQATDGGSTLSQLAGTKLTTTSFALGGSVGIALPDDGSLAMANGYLLYSYTDYIKAAGFARLNTFLFLIEADAGFEMNMTTRRYDAHINGNVCIAGGISIEGVRGCVGGNARVSSKGMVACLILIDDGFEPGIGYHWGDATPHIFNGVTDGCKPSQYWEVNIRGSQLAAASTADPGPGRARVPSPRAEAPLEFTVKQGDEAKDIELHGVGGAPAVEVRAPNGETITSVPNEMQVGDKLQTLAWEEYDFTWVGVANGQPGKYTITPLEGSVPISEMLETKPTPDEGIKGKVSGKGSKLVLNYDVGKDPGQKVTFVESGDEVRTELGTATKGKGKIKFAPTSGPAGQRQVVAEYEVDGIPAPVEVLDGFKAGPPPQAGKVKRVRVQRRGKSLKIAWAKASNAVGYGVVVSQKGGEQETITVKGRRRSARVSGIDPTEGGTVAVNAFGPLGDRGPSGSKSFKAVRKKPDRRIPYGQLGERPGKKSG